MSEEQDIALVLCARLDETQAAVPGSQVRTCRCGAEIWVATTTYTKSAGMRLELCCEKCLTSKERQEFADALAEMLQEMITGE